MARSRKAKVYVELTAASKAKFDDYTRKLTARVAKSVPDVVTDVAKWWLMNAIQVTPIEPDKEKPYAAVHGAVLGWLREDLPHWLYRRGMAATKPVRGRGYAKSGWKRALNALGAGGGGNLGPGGYADMRRAAAPAFAAWNDVPYIETLDRGGVLPDFPASNTGREEHPELGTHNVAPANILSRATSKSTRRLEIQLNKIALQALRV